MSDFKPGHRLVTHAPPDRFHTRRRWFSLLRTFLVTTALLWGCLGLVKLLGC